jgi:hypothetical protein
MGMARVQTSSTQPRVLVPRLSAGCPELVTLRSALSSATLGKAFFGDPSSATDLSMCHPPTGHWLGAEGLKAVGSGVTRVLLRSQPFLAFSWTMWQATPRLPW